MALNDALNQMDLKDIIRAFHHKAAENTFFSRAHGTFSRIDHILGHKSVLNWYKKKLRSYHTYFPGNQSQEKFSRVLQYMEVEEHSIKE